MSERRNDLMSHHRPSILPLHQGLEVDQTKEQVPQFHRQADSDQVLESVPTSQTLIDSLSRSEPEKDLDSRLFHPLPSFSMQTKNSHLKRELSPSSFIWRRSVQFPKPLETRESNGQNQESVPLVSQKEDSGQMLKMKEQELLRATFLWGRRLVIFGIRK